MNFRIVLLVSFLFYDAMTFAQPVHLQTEHLDHPLGIDAAHPRLSWQISGIRKGELQVAYEILVTSPGCNAWTSGKVRSDSQLVVYRGKPLQAFTQYTWQVKICDEQGKVSFSDPATFETGMMSMSNWKGNWIRDTRDKELKPAPYFLKSFSIEKKLISARAYIAVAGLYELYMNGHPIGDHFLDPMYTRFDRRNLYVTYDVTKELKTGVNQVGVILGNGWYNHQPHAVWNFDEAYWRARPAFCLDLRLTYSDGTVQTITSGEDWATALTDITFNSIYTGEQVDGRLDHISDTAWKEVMVCSTPSKNITAQQMVPIRLCEEISSKSIHAFGDSGYVFDIGQNIAGVSKLTIRGVRGTVIRVKHGERLDPQGHVDQSNINVHYRPVDNTEPFQTDIYILKGQGEETFMPRFNYKGFQYVEVTSDRPVSLTKASLTAYFVHSDVSVAGTFHTSKDIINKIWTATNNTYLSNLMGYPTDCPQREKNGWTGDAQIASETGLYNFDGITVYEKWMADHRDEQQPNGVLPSIIPNGVWGYEWGNGPDWTSSIAIIPWNLYLFYGDPKCLSDCYPNIRRYVDHIDELYPSGLTDWGLGDWVPVKSKTPKEFTSTAYYYVDVTILADAAKLFHNVNDYSKYHVLAEKIKKVFNSKYLDTVTCIYGKGFQTELSVALFWGLVPDQFKSRVADNLAKRVIADSVQLDVGLLGSKAILNALSENGHADLAYELASKDTYPSWGYWIANGATTLWENWPIDAKRDLSQNHIMFGEISAWFYKALGGIKPDPMHPGFKNILLHPYFVEGLDSCTATHNGPFGLIRSSWVRSGDRITWTVSVPANSSADVTLDIPPGQQLSCDGVLQQVKGAVYRKHVVSGTWVFVAERK